MQLDTFLQTTGWAIFQICFCDRLRSVKYIFIFKKEKEKKEAASKKEWGSEGKHVIISFWLTCLADQYIMLFTSISITSVNWVPN